MIQAKVEEHHVNDNGQGNWSRKKWKSHVNVLELKAANLAIMMFIMPQKNSISIHLRLDNIVVLFYLLKMGWGTKSQEMVSVSKNIWDYLLSRKIAITTAEYLLQLMNVGANWEFKQMEIKSKGIQDDLSDLKNTRHIRIWLKNTPPTSPIHVVETGPFQQRTGCISNQLRFNFHICFPHSYFDRKSFTKSTTRSGFNAFNKLFQNSLRLMVWNISGKAYTPKEYQKELQSYHQLLKFQLT